MKSTLRASALLGALAAPFISFVSVVHANALDTKTGNFVSSGSTDGGIGGIVSTQIIPLINNVFVPLLFAVAFIVFLYGVAMKYILSNGDETKVEEGHKLILWGLIGFFVMVSVWGMVNILVDTFGLNTPTNRALPTFTPL